MLWGTAAERDQLIEWARTIDFDVFATPTFKHPVSAERAFHAIAKWLRPVPAAYALLVRQVAEPHTVHLFIGGIPQSAPMLAALRDTWRHGNIDLDRFHPKGGALRYVIDRAEAIDLIGTPKVYRGR